MALDLGTLSAQVHLDTAPFDAGLRKLPQSAVQAGRKAGEGMQRGLAPGLSSITKMFGALGIAAIGAQFLDLVRQAAAASDATNKFKQTLKFAGIESKAIDTATRATKRYADQTVYDLADVQNTSAQLAANGIRNYRQLTEAAGNLNAVAGGNKDTFRAVAMVLTQTAGAGKLTTENWNQLTDAIPGASGQIQNAMRKNGAFTGNFRTAMEKGKITSAEFNKALLQLGNKPVAVNAAKSTKTFEGALGNLQATLVGGLADALTALKPMITDGMNALSSALPPILGGIKEFGGWVVKNQGWLKYLAEGLGLVTVAFIALNAVMAINPIFLVVMAIAALVAGLLWAYDNVGWFRDGVNAAFKVIGDVARWLWNNALAPTFRFIVTGTAGIILAIASMLDALSNVPGMEWAKGAASSLRDMGHAALNAANGIKAIPDPEVKTDDSKSQIKSLDKQIRSLKGKVVEAKAKGDTKEVERLQAKIKALKSKKVTLEAHVQKTGISTISINQKSKGWKLSAYANGGPFLPGWALVGEQGPELVKFAGAGHVYTAAQSRKMLASQPQQPGRAGMTLNITNHYPQAEPTSITTNRALATAATLGGK